MLSTRPLSRASRHSRSLRSPNNSGLFFFFLLLLLLPMLLRILLGMQAMSSAQNYYLARQCWSAYFDSDTGGDAASKCNKTSLLRGGYDILAIRRSLRPGLAELVALRSAIVLRWKRRALTPPTEWVELRARRSFDCSRMMSGSQPTMRFESVVDLCVGMRHSLPA